MNQVIFLTELHGCLYEQYHGGTNFGRTGASFVMPRYYDEAPLDEFGKIHLH
jgi:hypothetical protein